MSYPADPDPTARSDADPRPRSARVRTDAQGRVVLCKEATGPAGTARLEREARLLGLARHPGVVTLVALEHDPAGGRLTTAFVGSHTLATWTCPSPEHAAGIVAALAETVADLHQLGIVHGRLTADHVLVDREGRPVLTGFAEAACGAAGPADPTDPTHPTDPADVDGPSRPADVQALGALLRRLVAPYPEPTTLVPERRWRRHRHDAVARRSLLTLADHAEADDPTARPGARRLAAAILTAVPAATLGPPVGRGAEPGADPGPHQSPAHAPATVDASGSRPADLAGPRSAGPDPDPTAHGPGGHLDPSRAPRTNHGDDDYVAPLLALGATREAPTRRWPPRPSRPAPGPQRGPGRRRGLPAAAALVGLALVGVGAANLAHGERPDLRDAPVGSLTAPHPVPPPGTSGGTGGGTTPATTAPGSRPGAAPPPTTPATPTPAPAASAPTAPSAANPGDAGGHVPCPAATAEPTGPPVRCTDRHPAGIVAHDGRRYAIGEPGDEVAIGPFACPDPGDLAAVLRPATGEVFVFTTWADEADEATAVAAGQVPPGSTWAPSAVRDGCAPLVVRRPDGTTETVPPPARSTP